jgi:hypothetical protein
MLFGDRVARGKHDHEAGFSSAAMLGEPDLVDAVVRGRIHLLGAGDVACAEIDGCITSAPATAIARQFSRMRAWRRWTIVGVFKLAQSSAGRRLG